MDPPLSHFVIAVASSLVPALPLPYADFLISSFSTLIQRIAYDVTDCVVDYLLNKGESFRGHPTQHTLVRVDETRNALNHLSSDRAVFFPRVRSGIIEC